MWRNQSSQDYLIIEQDTEPVPALLWLERRMYQQISSAMKGVLGKDLDLQFVAVL
jgi:hypothetical protein